MRLITIVRAASEAKFGIIDSTSRHLPTGTADKHFPSGVAPSKVLPHTISNLYFLPHYQSDQHDRRPRSGRDGLHRAACDHRTRGKETKQTKVASVLVLPAKTCPLVGLPYHCIQAFQCT